MCYSKSICTRLQWRNVFEIRHYVNISNKKETSTDIGPTVLWQFWNHRKKIEVFQACRETEWKKDSEEREMWREERQTGAGEWWLLGISFTIHALFVIDECHSAIQSQWKTLRLVYFDDIKLEIRSWYWDEPGKFGRGSSMCRKAPISPT